MRSAAPGLMAATTMAIAMLASCNGIFGDLYEEPLPTVGMEQGVVCRDADGLGGTVLIDASAYDLLSLRARWAAVAGWQLWVAVENLTDYRPTHYYNNSPATTGRTLRVGCMVQIDSK